MEKSPTSPRTSA